MRARQLRVVGAVCLALGLGGAAGPAFAQTTVQTGLSPRQLLIRLTNGAGVGTGVSNIGEIVADLVGLEVSTAPLGSSAGGFTFTFDPFTRTFRRAAPSFGPMFGERAITAGERRANAGVIHLRRRYDTLDGVNLRDGSLRTVGLSAGSTLLYEGTVGLEVETDTTVVFASVSLNDVFELGVAVPYVRLRMSGVHRIGDEIVEGSASASGVGDVAVRAKIRVYPIGQGGVAIGVESRLPTGDKEALLGTGTTRTLVRGIWSASWGRVAPHASAGVEYWNHPFLVYDPLLGASIAAGRHSVVYTGGVEWAAADRLTVTGEVIGRVIPDGARLDYRDLPFQGNPFGITSASVASVDPAGIRQAGVAVGAKWNVAGSVLITAGVLRPVGSAGLRERFTPVIGLDWAF